MQNTEYADFNWEKYTLHVQPKPWRHFRLKGKKKKKSAKDRFIPIPAKLVWKIKDRMRERNAQPHDLVFPNGNGKPDGHFLRKLKSIAKKARVEGAELHRFRKSRTKRKNTPTAAAWRCTHKIYAHLTREIPGLARDLPFSSFGCLVVELHRTYLSLPLPWRILQVDWRVALVRASSLDI